MSEVFLKLINMSITASWMVLAVVLLRLIMKKIPKAFSCLLWMLVGIRLVLPFSLESIFSLIPSTDTVPQTIVFAKEPTIDSGVTIINEIVNPVMIASFAPSNELTSINPIQVWLAFYANIWVLGIIAMLLYAIISYAKLRKSTSASIETEKGIYICDSVQTPFILGLFRPRIILPSSMDENNAKHVIAHEKAHLSRFDHLWKPLGFLLLTVYWFNPAMWVAYILFCRDIELACDERVIKDLSTEEKAAYSSALLACSIQRRMISACPLAFGEVGVKERVKGVLNYKKPTFWLIVAAIVIPVAVCICFLTDPKAEVNREKTSANTDVTTATVVPTVTSVAITDIENNEEIFSTMKTYAFVGITENYDIYSDAINTDVHTLNGEKHLLLHKMESVEDISTFKEKFSDLQFNHNLDNLPRFDDVTKDFDDNFFKENVLLLSYTVSEGWANYVISLAQNAYNNVLFCVEEKSDKNSDALYGWLLCIAINKKHINGDTKFDAIIIKEDSIVGTWSSPASAVGLDKSEIPENRHFYYAFYEDGTGAEWNDFNYDVTHVNTDMSLRAFTYKVDKETLTLNFSETDSVRFRYSINNSSLILSDTKSPRSIVLTRIIKDVIEE